MVKKAVSWALLGALAFLWWWVGYRWPYLNVRGNQWTSVYLLFTLFSMAVLMRGNKAAGGGLLDGFFGTVRGFLPNLLWLALAAVAMRAVAWAVTGIVNPVDHFTHAIVAAVAAGFTTSLWYGAIANATADS